MDKTQVLIVVLGTSPAILTETVWALAVNEGIVPDEIEIWTTKTGKNVFEKAVLTKDAKTGKTVWDSLLDDLSKRKIDITDKLALDEDSWKIFANTKKQHLEDLLTTEDNLATADKMLKELRGHDDPSKQILLSIAGGRKTMGALALQCMSLVGREEDKVYHVLVNPPFDTGLTPSFFFPEKKGKKWQSRETRDKTTVTDKDAKINLFSVPYIRVRPLYEEKLKEKVVSFSKLCERVQEKINKKPVLKINKTTGEMWLDDKKIKLNAVETVTLLMLIKMKRVGFDLAKALYDYKAKLKATSGYKPPLLHDFLESKKFETEDTTNEKENKKEDEKEISHHLSVVLNGCRKKGIPEGLIPLRSDIPDLSCVKVEIVE